MQPKAERKAGGGKAAGKSFARTIHPGAKLVIVESPAKARTVGRFLGSGYEVRASVGHVRDLLRSQLSVDVENEFVPKYRVPDDKKEIVKTLKAAAAEASEIYLATDPDREGEAIAWHLLEAIGDHPGQRAARRLPRDHDVPPSPRPSATAASSTCDWSMPSRRGASSTGWWATRSARCCGSGCEAGCRPAASSPWRCG